MNKTHRVASTLSRLNFVSQLSDTNCRVEVGHAPHLLLPCSRSIVPNLNPKRTKKLRLELYSNVKRAGGKPSEDGLEETPQQNSFEALVANAYANSLPCANEIHFCVCFVWSDGHLRLAELGASTLGVLGDSTSDSIV
jgi:hypothetical protein